MAASGGAVGDPQKHGRTTLSKRRKRRASEQWLQSLRGGVVWRSLALTALAFLCCRASGAQVAILQIRVTSGEGMVHAAGARDPRGIAVEVTDETGRPVEGAAVTLHLPDQGPSGTFGNGLHTQVALTDAQGRAVVHGIEFNRVPGRFEVRIVASKEQARAGTVTFQYISAAATQGALAEQTGAGGRHRKLLLIAAAVAGAGAAAAALALGHSAPQSATAESTTVVSIGPPTITVGKP